MKQVISEAAISEQLLVDDGGNLRLNSIVVAEGTNKKHNHIMALVATYKDRLECLAPLIVIEEKRGLSNFEEMIGEKIFYSKTNQITESAQLTEQQIGFIVNHINATPFIRDFNLKLIFAFHSARTTGKE